MADSQSVTTWVELLRGGDASAATPLWRRYYAALVSEARRRMANRVRRAGDEEDVVQAAFASFCRGVADNRFPNIADRHDLWRVLLVLTIRKERDHARRETADQRGGGAVQSLDDWPDVSLIERAIDAEPTPEFAAAIADELDHILHKLPGDDLREVLIARLEGYTVAEIAATRKTSKRSIERKLEVIRAYCREFCPPG